MTNASSAYLSADAAFDLYSDKVWFISRAGSLLGPISTWELALAAKYALLAPSDRVWKPELAHWVVVGEVAGLLPQSQAQATLGLAVEPQRPAVEPHRPAVEPRRNSEAVSAKVESRDLVSSPPSSYWPDIAALPDNAASEAQSIVEDKVSVTRRLAETIALQVVQMLDRYKVKTFDDIATDERLRQLTGLTFDALPLAVRATLNHSVGRSFTKDRIYDVLFAARASLLSPKARAAAIDIAVDSAATSVRSYVSGTWTELASRLGSVPGANGAREPELIEHIRSNAIASGSVDRMML